MKNFLLVEHDGYLDEFTFKAAIDRGLCLFLVTQTKEEWFDKYVKQDNLIVTNTDDIDGLILEVKQFIKERRLVFSGIGTFFEKYVLHTSMLAKELNLISVDIEAAQKSSRNKFKMRNACKEAGINQPEFEMVNIHEIDKIKNFIISNGKSVLKPINGAGSIGVMKLDEYSSVENVTKNIIIEINDEQNNYIAHNQEEFVIEKYLEGKVVSVDGLIQNEEIHFIGETEFYLGEEPKFIQIGGVTPTTLSVREVIKAKDLVSKIIRATRFNNCGFHCELRITNNGPILIEIACRTPGGPLLLNYNSAYGIDGTKLIYDIWLGDKINVVKTASKHVLHKDVYTTKSGNITSIDIPEKIRSMKNLLDIIPFTEIGQKVSFDSFHNTSLYYYSLVADTHKELMELSEYLESEIKFKIEI